MTIGKWIAVGAAVGTAATIVMKTFWGDIRNWITSVAANAVEKAFGYKARDRMYKAIAKVDRLANVVRNRITVYTKKDDLDTHFLKTDIVAECSAYEIESDVLEEIRKNSELMQEFRYTT